MQFSISTLVEKGASALARTEIEDLRVSVFVQIVGSLVSSVKKGPNADLSGLPFSPALVSILRE